MTTSFIVNLADLTKILSQIKIAERDAAGEDLINIIAGTTTPTAQQIATAALQPLGLRTVDGSYNHLTPGQELVGAADQLFPRLLPTDFRNFEPSLTDPTLGDTYTIVRADVPGAPPGGITIINNNYNPTIAGSHSVADAQLRIISNLIVNATLNNPAAVEAALILAGSTNPTADAAAVMALHAGAVAASANAVTKAQTDTAYAAAIVNATVVSDRASDAASSLLNLFFNVEVGIAVSQAHQDLAAAAVVSANAAIDAQRLIVSGLQHEVNVTPSSVAAGLLASAQTLLAQLHTIADAAVAIQGLLTSHAAGLLASDILIIEHTAFSGTVNADALAADAFAHFETLTATEATAAAAATLADTAMLTATATLGAAVAADGLMISSDGSITVENRSPDIGLSPPFNGWMTFFGQFFDHGLDLVTKGGNGTVYIPLAVDDPLYDKGQDGLVGDQRLRDANGNLTFKYTVGTATTTVALDITGAYHDAAGNLVTVPTTLPAGSTLTAVMHNDDGYGADGLLGTVDDRPNFMALTRATTFINPTTGLATETLNTTTPYIDQNQTYTSIASHQVFLREYKMVDIATDNVNHAVAVSTGHMLDGAKKGSIANWAEVKAQAISMLGIRLGDFDVNDVPKLVTDPYGKFIAGPNGFAQVYVDIFLKNITTNVVTKSTVLMEGKLGGLDLANLAAELGAPPVGFTLVKVAAVGTGHAFLNDISHHAAPGTYKDAFGIPHNQTADLDIRDVNHDGKIDSIDITANDHDVNEDGVVDARDLVADDHVASTYDNEMLDAHFITGDGRGNENIGLTAVHTVFHAEHNRLVEADKITILQSGDAAVVNEWLLASDAAGNHNRITQTQLNAITVQLNAALALPIDTQTHINDKAAALLAVSAQLEWDGERLFQAGRFATEMQYQHLVFEEFARKVQPNIDAFVFTNSANLDPSITAEFAHVVYRFGHSMLTDTVARLDIGLNVVGDANPNAPGAQDLSLIQAFLNPQAFDNNGAQTISQATGSIIRGMALQTGNEIDEFVVEGVRSNLVGLPLDLAALNMARARDTGVPSFNATRQILHDMTGDAALTPYTSWLDFAQHIKNPLSIINFIAAYGTHAAIQAATTAEAKRAAATLLVMGDGNAANGTDTLINGVTVTEADRQAFLHATGIYAADGAGPNNDSLGGLNTVDLWIGGLAESKMEFGGMLGATFNYIFEYQLEHLQNGDRLYYLSRTQGMNMLNMLEANTFSDLVMRNSDLGDLHSTHVAGSLFDTPSFTIELDTLVAQADYNGATVAGIDPGWTADDLLHHLDLANPSKVVRDFDDPNTAVNEITAGIHTLKFTGGEHVVLGGTEGRDRIYGDRGIDTLWGDGGDDYLNGGSEADQVFGGDGDDIIEDFFGDGDFLRGNLGNDVISDTHGFGDVLFGDAGKDFLMAGSDVIEMFAGEGDDFILGGLGADTLLGNEGDDWIEGGEGFDGIGGDNSELFFNSPIIGHDVLNGSSFTTLTGTGSNDTDYDGESGDDIMFLNEGITRANGMLGFDWVIDKGDHGFGPGGGVEIDLGIGRLTQFADQAALTLRDRNDSVEAASGWIGNDRIIGTSSPVGAVGVVGGLVGGPATDSMLLSQNVSLISGLAELISLMPATVTDGAGVTRTVGLAAGLTALQIAALAKDTTVFNPQNGGDILLGGSGSDTFFGKAGDDLIDGDRWLNVRLEVHVNKDGTGPLLLTNAAVGNDGSVDSLNEIKGEMLAGRINPGQLKIVREIIDITAAQKLADVDIVEYAGPLADYTLTRNANGTVTVTDNVITPITIFDPFGAVGGGATVIDALLGNEGTDTLNNVEIIRFANRDATGAVTSFTDVGAVAQAATGAAGIVDANGGTPTEGQTLTVNTAGIADANGIKSFSFVWQSAPLPAGNVWTPIGTTAADGTFVAATGAFTPGQNQVGQLLRVVVTVTDAFGATSAITSAATLGVGDLITTNLTTQVNGTAFDDSFVDGGAGAANIFNGGLGNDTLNGGAGADTAAFANAVGTATFALDAAGNLLVTTATEGTDTLIAMERATFGRTTYGLRIGTAAADNFAATAAPELFLGLGGIDTVTYSGTTAVNANLALGTATNGDRYYNIANLTGGTGADTLTGDANANVLIGGAGADIIGGGGGADTIRYTIGDGADTVDGGTSGTDIDTLAITGTAVNDTLTVLYDGSKLTTVQGGTVINIESVTADLLAGTGDTLSYGTTAAAVTVNLTAGTASGFTSILNIENVTGGSGGDSLTGDGNANVLNGGLGNDTLNGGAGTDTAVFTSAVASAAFALAASGDLQVTTAEGTDTLNSIERATFGGVNYGLRIGTAAGNDIFAATTAPELFFGFGGIDTVTYGTAITANLATGVASNGDLFFSIENLTGSGGIDTLTGDANANVLIGGAGADTLNGGGGDDTLNGGTGTDAMRGGSGSDTYVVDVATDVVDERTYTAAGVANNDTDAGGIDTVQAGLTYALTSSTAAGAASRGLIENLTLTGAGNINGTGNELANVITGNTGTNILTGLGGDDTYIVQNANDTVVEAASGGIDTVQSSVTFTIGANVENLTLTGTTAINGTGNADNNIITGNAANNTLNGGAGADTLNGGAGADTLIGGIGADVIDTGAPNDNVQDIVRFTANTEFGDTINNFDADGATAADDRIEFSALLNTAYDDGNNNDVFLFASGNGAAGTVAANFVNGNTKIEALFLGGVGAEGVANANLGSAALAAAAFSAEFNITNAANGEDALLVINDTDANSAAVWQWVQAAGGTAGIDASELTLIAIINANATITTDNFVFVP